MHTTQAVSSAPWPFGEWLLLQDRPSLQTWSATPEAWGALTMQHQVEHLPGLTRIQHQRGNMHCELQSCEDHQLLVQQRSLRLHNLGSVPLTLRLVAVVTWPPGVGCDHSNALATSMHKQHLPHGRLTALLAMARLAECGSDQATGWLAVASPDSGTGASTDDWTCDCRELVDAWGQPLLPACLGQQLGSGRHACAALAQTVTLAPGQRLGKAFLLGRASNPRAARAQAISALGVPPAWRQAEALAPMRRQDSSAGQAPAAPPSRWWSARRDLATVV